MRYGPEHKKQTHDRIVSDAARLFREKGYQGCGVDVVMAAAGLTAGGFYAHFKNKDALLAEVLSRSFKENAAHTVTSVDDEKTQAGTLNAWIDTYLSKDHRDAPGAGCPIPALAADVARQDRAARAVFTSSVREQVDELAATAPGSTPRERKDAALRTLAAAVGGMLLARAVNDSEFSDHILRVVREGARLDENRTQRRTSRR